ncbi:MAG TPA: sigma-70 family RNA polymerase sigma factor [Mogibacterium sp.]|nr:sigma-70 family RNA polymerase sigma factor [Mogibacterium sp.]
MLPILIANMISSEADRSKMELLYMEYEQILFSVANNMLHDTQKAEDAVQDTFIRIIDRPDKIKGIKSPQTKRFLIIITENICRNMLKRKSFTNENLYGDYDELDYVSGAEYCSDPESEYFEQYDIKLIKDAFRRLPADAQDIYYLYTVEELSIKEIANLLGENYEKMKKKIQRIRQELKKAVQVV